VENQKLKLSRTLGFEIECFLDNVPYHTNDWGDRYPDYEEINYSNCEVGGDGSLYGGDGTGIEVKTHPINDLNIVESVFGELSDDGMNVNDTCGLHIHVDTSDYSVEDKVRLLRFGAGIELLMFSLVDDTRYYGRSDDDNHNGYCIKLHKDWRKIYRKDYINQDIDYSDMHDIEDFTEYVQETRRRERQSSRIWNGRYQWLNASVSGIPTCEFRIFSSTEDYQQAQRFGMLAYHIIETVKYSTVSQIRFIIKSIYQETTTDGMFRKFFDSIGLDEEFRPSVQNERVEAYLDSKYCQRNREQQQALAELDQAI
jgi:hypothetical protein